MAHPAAGPWPVRGGRAHPRAAYPDGMTTPAHELPSDDPGALSQAVRRAAAGEVVRLVASDGRRVADVVPPAQTGVERADRVTHAFMTATGAVPTLEHYRTVYARAGADWPGDDVVRGLYPVADAS